MRNSPGIVQQMLAKDKAQQKLKSHVKIGFPENITSDNEEQKKLIAVTDELQSIFDELTPKIIAAKDQVQKKLDEDPKNQELKTCNALLDDQMKKIAALARDVKSFKSGVNIEFNTKKFTETLGYIRRTFDRSMAELIEIDSAKIESAKSALASTTSSDDQAQNAPPPGKVEAVVQPEKYLTIVEYGKRKPTQTQITEAQKQTGLRAQREAEYLHKVLTNETARTKNRLDDVSSQVTPLFKTLARAQEMLETTDDDKVKKEFAGILAKANEFKDMFETFILLIATIEDAAKEWPDHTSQEFIAFEKKFNQNAAKLKEKAEKDPPDPIALLYVQFLNASKNYLVIQEDLNDLRKNLEKEVRKLTEPLEKEYSDALKDAAQLLKAIKDKVSPEIAPIPEAPDLAPAQGKVTDSAPAQGKVTDSAPAQGKVTDSAPAQGKVTDSAPAQGKVTDSAPAQGKVTDSAPAQGKVPDSVPAQGKVPIDFSSMKIKGVQKLRQDVKHYYNEDKDFLSIDDNARRIISNYLEAHPNLNPKIRDNLAEILNQAQQQINKLNDLWRKQFNYSSDESLVDNYSLLKDQFYDVVNWCQKTNKILMNLTDYVKGLESTIQRETDKAARVEMTTTLVSVQWELMKMIQDKEKAYRDLHKEDKAVPQNDPAIKELYKNLTTLNTCLENLSSEKWTATQVQQELDKNSVFKQLLETVKPQKIEVVATAEVKMTR